MNGFQGRAGLIFSIAEMLRGDYKPSDFGHVTLPFVLLRRLDAVLVLTKPAVLKEYEAFKDTIPNLDPILQRAAGQTFYNTSRFDFDGKRQNSEYKAIIRRISPCQTTLHIT